MCAVSSLTRRRGVKANQLAAGDRPAHEWYRFVLSFPPHLVRQYVERLGLGPDDCVLDPFCGTGTTLVECKKNGIPSVGLEPHPMSHFASSVKVDWAPEPEGLAAYGADVAEAVSERLESQGIIDEPFFQPNVKGIPELRGLPPEQAKLLLKNSISPLPLHKALTLLDVLNERSDEAYDRHARLALARALVSPISNLTFGPEVGVGSPKTDTPVISPWLSGVDSMGEDLRQLKGLPGTPSRVVCADARDVDRHLAPESIDAVITSPPYPNEKDYTRTTRLETVLLGFVRDKGELRALKENLVRSNTRNVYKGDRDDEWIAEHGEILRIADAIEARRIELGKTSGFEKQYKNVTRHYFGGMARHLAGLRKVLRPGARLAYVVGDQASYLRVMIRTGKLLADIAQSLGYELVGIDLFRTRLATATRQDLREEVVVLRWPGA